MSVSRTIEQYKTMEQLQAYAEAQQTTILQLSKKIQKLEDENKQLKTSGIPTLIKPNSKNIQKLAKEDSEDICALEISKFRNVALERELTLEEAKKLEIYYRIFNQINSGPKKQEKEVEKLSDDELLKLVKSDGTRKE